MSHFVCIGAPFFLGQRMASRTEVAAIRDSGLIDEIGATWVDFVPQFSGSPDLVTAVNRALAQTVGSYRRHIPLIFASDCTSSLGAVKGLGGGLGVVWLDAHGDFNTPETTPSGFLGGMPLAMLVGRGDPRYLAGVELAPLDERDVILSDARDLDPGEAAALRASAITHLPDVRDLLTAALPDKPLYLHIDVDVVNLADMPGTSYPAAGGPTLADVAAAVERVARDGQVIGVLFSLWNSEITKNDLRPLEGTLHLARAVVRGLQASPGRLMAD